MENLRGLDFMNLKKLPLDVERAVRALSLRVQDVGEGNFLVWGDSGELYGVSLYPYFSCYCGDAIFRDSICKHLIAALLFVDPPEIEELAKRARARRAALEEEARRAAAETDKARQKRKGTVGSDGAEDDPGSEASLSGVEVVVLEMPESTPGSGSDLALRLGKAVDDQDAAQEEKTPGQAKAAAQDQSAGQSEEHAQPEGVADQVERVELPDWW